MKQVVTSIYQKNDRNANEKIPIGAQAENVIVQVKDKITSEITSLVNLQSFLDNLKVDGVVQWIDYL